MVVQHTTSRSGELYSYFYCNGHKHNPARCQLKSVLIHTVEQRVADIYQRISLTPEERIDIEQQLYTQIAEAQSSAIQERRHLVAQEVTYRREQQQLLQAHYAGAIPLELLKKEQGRITHGLAEVTKQLDQISRDSAITKAHVSAALNLLEDCATTYRRAPNHVEKLLNQAFFQTILISPPLPGDHNRQAASSADVRAVDQLNPYISWVLHQGTKKTPASSDGDHENTSETSAAGEPNPGIRQDIGFRPVTLVDVGERCGNKRRVVKRLNTAWNRSVGNACTPVEPVAYAESGVVSEPRRRSRTPLTEQEVDAMRTARANGVSVSTIARQFRVHRGTVWEKTHY